MSLILTQGLGKLAEVLGCLWHHAPPPSLLNTYIDAAWSKCCGAAGGIERMHSNGQEELYPFPYAACIAIMRPSPA
jgi:hypothetical protein